MGQEPSRIEILEREGWTKRFVASEPRLSEAVELYREAGFHVHLEPLPQGAECHTCAGKEDGGECRICFEGVEGRYKMIFTMPKKDGGPSPHGDLF